MISLFVIDAVFEKMKNDVLKNENIKFYVFDKRYDEVYPPEKEKDFINLQKGINRHLIFGYNNISNSCVRYIFMEIISIIPGKLTIGGINIIGYQGNTEETVLP